MRCEWTSALIHKILSLGPADVAATSLASEQFGFALVAALRGRTAANET